MTQGQVISGTKCPHENTFRLSLAAISHIRGKAAMPRKTGEDVECMSVNFKTFLKLASVWNPSTPRSAARRICTQGRVG